jgi:hypothetical protein
MTAKDPLFIDAAKIIVSEQIASTILLQRRLKLGYNRVDKIMDQLQETGIVGSSKGASPREVLIKGDVALNNILKGLGLNPSDSIYDNLENQQETPQNQSESSTFSVEDISSNKKTKFSIGVIVISILIGIALFYLIGDAGFGSELASFMKMSHYQYQSFVYLLGTGVITLVLWLIKDTPLGFLWKWYKLFWLVLFATLFVNYAKKQVKEWWKKD